MKTMSVSRASQEDELMANTTHSLSKTLQQEESKHVEEHVKILSIPSTSTIV